MKKRKIFVKIRSIIFVAIVTILMGAFIIGLIRAKEYIPAIICVVLLVAYIISEIMYGIIINNPSNISDTSKFDKNYFV